MAELYKLIIVAMILGLGASLIDATAREGDLIENWIEKSLVETWIENNLDNSEKMNDEEQILEQQSENTIEDSSGISTGIMAIGLIIIVIKMAIMSVVITFKVATYEAGGDTILRLIGISTALFLAMLQGFIGMKIYSWIANNDTK